MVVLQVLALVGYGGFLSATFGWRTLKIKRATGESRWREPISRTDAIGEIVCAAGCLLSLVAAPLAMAGVDRRLGIGWPMAQGIGSAITLGFGTHWRSGLNATASQRDPTPRIRLIAQASKPDRGAWPLDADPQGSGLRR